MKPYHYVLGLIRNSYRHFMFSSKVKQWITIFFFFSISNPQNHLYYIDTQYKTLHDLLIFFTLFQHFSFISDMINLIAAIHVEHSFV